MNNSSPKFKISKHKKKKKSVSYLELWPKDSRGRSRGQANYEQLFSRPEGRTERGAPVRGQQGPVAVDLQAMTEYKDQVRGPDVQEE